MIQAVMTPTRLLAQQALLPAGWQRNVLLEVGDDGCFSAVKVISEQDLPTLAAEIQRVEIILPGMANLHSHAFQRALAGLTEYRSNPTDSFWSWRALMYRFAHKLSPESLYAIALQLYIEMLKAGYTSVCEFHYLHHDVEGRPYADFSQHAQCLIAAARKAGIGLTLLPALYQYSGFGAQPPQLAQARFINSPEWILKLLQHLQHVYPQHVGLRYGVAPHSLRAVTPASLTELLEGVKAWDVTAPVHIHIAEQTKEVDDCLAVLGARPVQWLLDQFAVDHHWCLIHATHMTAAETEALAKSGAVAGICPTTEANLGDGIFNGVAYTAAQGHWGIGSDSHISVSVVEELRLYEYSQRLLHRQRNVLVGTESTSVGNYLYRSAQAGGALATGRAVAGLAAGQSADLLVLDDSQVDLVANACKKQSDIVLDSLIFSQHGSSLIQDVMSGGRWVIQQGQHVMDESSQKEYRYVLQGLLE